MSDLIVALGLVFVIEGALYALFPNAMQRVMSQALDLPATSLRTMGLIAAIVGFVVVWAVRAFVTNG